MGNLYNRPWAGPRQVLGRSRVDAGVKSLRNQERFLDMAQSRCRTDLISGVSEGTLIDLDKVPSSRKLRPGSVRGGDDAYREPGLTAQPAHGIGSGSPR